MVGEYFEKGGVGIVTVFLKKLFGYSFIVISEQHIVHIWKLHDPRYFRNLGEVCLHCCCNRCWLRRPVALLRCIRNPVDVVRIFEICIVVQLISDVEDDEQAGCEASGKSKYVDE